MCFKTHLFNDLVKKALYEVEFRCINVMTKEFFTVPYHNVSNCLNTPREIINKKFGISNKVKKLYWRYKIFKQQTFFFTKFVQTNDVCVQKHIENF